MPMGILISKVIITLVDAKREPKAALNWAFNDFTSIRPLTFNSAIILSNY